MCRWMESHFHGWIDNNGASENSGRYGFKNGKNVYFIKFNKCVNSSQDDPVKWLYKVDA